MPFRSILLALFSAILVFLSAEAQAASASADLTAHWAGYAILCLFILAYVFVIVEEVIHLQK